MLHSKLGISSTPKLVARHHLDHQFSYLGCPGYKPSGTPTWRILATKAKSCTKELEELLEVVVLDVVEDVVLVVPLSCKLIQKSSGSFPGLILNCRVFRIQGVSSHG